MGEIAAPVLLSASHDTGEFCSGNNTLDDWLQKRALKNQDTGASKTFVISEVGSSRVIGYYALATGSVERNTAKGSFARAMPHPIPVIILCRLAIDAQHQGKRLGAGLLKDAMLRTLAVAHNVGVRGILVHAISESAKRFYLKYGFKESAIEPMTLLISTKTLEAHL